MAPIPKQLCTYCNQLLPQTDFTPSVRGKRGYYCKPCKQISNAQRDRRKLDDSDTPVEAKRGRRRKTYAEKLANRAEKESQRASDGLSRVHWVGCPCPHPATAYGAIERLKELTAKAIAHSEAEYAGKDEPAPVFLGVYFDHSCNPCGTTYRTVALVDDGTVTRVDRIELDAEGSNLASYRQQIPDFPSRRIYAAPPEQ
ncbi:hypothetical protein ACEZCY_30925 [Streptacidiphilus sp. N1-12]|uniref:Uncharacterized protein n=2 Tax=Streptacidiphilus alkalitolerans TaxID=3342712 RepID=A0ABV6VID0_9ACTN